MINELKKELIKVIYKKSFFREKVILASGQESDYYFDMKMTTLDPKGSVLVAKIILKEMEKNKVKCIGGYSIGADPIVSSVVAISEGQNYPVSGFLVRKEVKKHGRMKLIEGNLPKGDKVAVIDDVVTTGGSTFKAIQAVEQEGTIVGIVFVVVDREQGGVDKLKEEGYKVYSIFKESDIFDYEKSVGCKEL